MGDRLDLHDVLTALLGSDNVYFQPPASMNMRYPCIRYERTRISTFHADNKPYRHEKHYMITVIDEDPDSLIPDQVAALSTCQFDRHYTSAGLNHDVFNMFF